MFENCGKYRHPHLAILLAMFPAILPAILRAMLNMFNFPAILLAIFSYLEGEINYILPKIEGEINYILPKIELKY